MSYVNYDDSDRIGVGVGPKKKVSDCFRPNQMQTAMNGFQTKELLPKEGAGSGGGTCVNLEPPNKISFSVHCSLINDVWEH